MKTIVVFAALLAVAFAFPEKRHVEEDDLKKQEVVMIRNTPLTKANDDQYNFGYEYSDGQMRDETAQIDMSDPEKPIIRVQGSYAWVNPEDGKTYRVDYIADENGFQPQGAHLPVAPIVSPVPATPITP